MCLDSLIVFLDWLNTSIKSIPIPCQPKVAIKLADKDRTRPWLETSMPCVLDVTTKLADRDRTIPWLETSMPCVLDVTTSIIPSWTHCLNNRNMCIRNSKCILYIYTKSYLVRSFVCLSMTLIWVSSFSTLFST